MSERLVEFDIAGWQTPIATPMATQATEALESGKVVYLRELSFLLKENESQFLSADVADANSKNVRYDIRIGTLAGTSLSPELQRGMRSMMNRYADSTRALVNKLFPAYRTHIIQARTSYRPVEAEGRLSSYRKDDTRLHVDAFPATPTAGRRILRVFTNVNPLGVPRHWRVGEPFEEVVQRFLKTLPKPNWLAAKVLQMINLTRGERTAYDHYMHHLHNAMKANLDYQKNVSQEDVYFPPGSTWIVFSDQVSHAAMSGQFMFEQTFYLPVAHMVNEQQAPLRVLERAAGRSLV